MSSKGERLLGVGSGVKGDARDSASVGLDVAAKTRMLGGPERFGQLADRCAPGGVLSRGLGETRPLEQQLGGTLVGLLLKEDRGLAGQRQPIVCKAVAAIVDVLPGE